MAEVCVVNASPLNFLSRGGHLPLVRSVAAHVWVPRAVAEELWVRGADDGTARQLTSWAWLAIRETTGIASTIMQWGDGVRGGLNKQCLQKPCEPAAGSTSREGSGTAVIGTKVWELVAET